MNDNKHNDPAFMRQWTTRALQTLAANHVFASYHFNVSNATPLIGSAQGQAFQTMFQQLVGKGTSLSWPHRRACHEDNHKGPPCIHPAALVPTGLSQ